MKQEQIIRAFSRLGIILKELGNGNKFPGTTSGITETEYEELQGIINRQFQLNGWFTKEAVQKSFIALGQWLEKTNLETWLSHYRWNEQQPKKVGIIMAGNIPLVGFHDFLCVLLSGNTAVCKMSSDDKTLLPALVNNLYLFLPELKERIIFSEGKIGEIDAVIATGSNNSTLYFEQYFGKYPHIFRKNRTSVAVLNGNESKEELEALGEDLFTYFGLGCRNVSHLLLPQDYNLSHFFEGIFSHGDIINHFKYSNNYDYNKAVYLLNQLPLFDNNFVLLRECEDLHSPLAMIHYHFYKSEKEIDNYLHQHADNIQVVIGKNRTPFGTAQSPTLMDYADGIDTMKWLENLN